MDLSRILSIVALIMTGCYAQSPGQMDGSVTSEDARVRDIGGEFDSGSAPDLGESLDARTPPADQGRFVEDLGMNDSEVSDVLRADTSIDDASIDDASIIDASVAIEPVAPCGDDLQIACGVVVPRIPVQAAVPAGELDPSAMGPHAVESVQAAVRGPGGEAIPVSIFSPRGQMGPMPLVIALPGHGTSYQRYPFMTEHLASHGFIVVGADVAGGGLMEPAEHAQKTAKVLAVLDWALTGSEAAPRIDSERIAAMGHSLGGKLSFYAAALDDRIDVVVAWDPQNSGGPPCFLGDTAQGNCNDFPVAPNCIAEEPGIIHQIRAESLIFGAEDRLITPDTHMWAVHFYRGAPSPTHYVSMPAVGHAAWFADNAVTRLTRGAHTALLLSRLKGVTGLEAWLPGGEILRAGQGVTEVMSK